MSTKQAIPNHSTMHPHTAVTDARVHAHQRKHSRERHRAHRRWIGWTATVVIAFLAVVAVLIGGRTTPTVQAGFAPVFRLASTSGREVSLSDFAGKNVLLYFNEGVGCGACFNQAVRLESDGGLNRAGVTMLPIVMNTAKDVDGELTNYGVRTPYLVDLDGAISRAYGTLGTGHHANLPGHTFILVGPDGKIRWRGDYPGMWIEPAELVAAVTTNLG